MADVEDVRRLALGLPETTERPSYGTPGFRVKDRLFARLRFDGGGRGAPADAGEEVLVLMCGSIEEKQALIASEPRKFFTTSHYDEYPMVLVRLARVGARELRELLVEAWLARAPKRVRAAHEEGLGS
ncbi:MAG TPA: MmcQ/YjbR family DNA-binding protein [Conexibacter sp.]|nr:MmcQ/YjbR family DNA-binding protein [Conexibacter sp.]